MLDIIWKNAKIILLHFSLTIYTFSVSDKIVLFVVYKNWVSYLLFMISLSLDSIFSLVHVLSLPGEIFDILSKQVVSNLCLR